MMKLDVILSIKPLMEDYAIWIETEEWEAGQWDPQDCNSDVLVIITKESANQWRAARRRTARHTAFFRQNVRLADPVRLNRPN